jgi:hypothetical protein
VCRLYVENVGDHVWVAPGDADEPFGIRVELVVSGGRARPRVLPVRHRVGPGMRAHFVFEVRAPAAPGPFTLRAWLRPRSWLGRPRVPLLETDIVVEPAGADVR